MKGFDLKKIIALVLAIICAASLAACGKTEQGEALEIKNEDIVLSFGDNAVDYEEYRYFYLNTKLSMENGDAAYWTNNPDKEAQLKDDVLYSVSQVYAIEAAAAENGVILSDEAKADTESLVQSYLDAYGEEEFGKMLEQSYFTLDLFKRISNVIALESELYQYVVENDKLGKEAEVKATLNSDEYIRVMHILYADEETAKGVLEEAKNATDEEFYELAQKAEDPGMLGNTEGYCFTYGMMVEPFEKASFELEVGETSDLIKSDYGYHIIRRLEKSEEYINENYEALATTMLQTEFYEYIDTFAKKFVEEVKLTELYDKITVANAK